MCVRGAVWWCGLNGKSMVGIFLVVVVVVVVVVAVVVLVSVAIAILAQDGARFTRARHK